MLPMLPPPARLLPCGRRRRRCRCRWDGGDEGGAGRAEGVAHRGISLSSADSSLDVAGREAFAAAAASGEEGEEEDEGDAGEEEEEEQTGGVARRFGGRGSSFLSLRGPSSPPLLLAPAPAPAACSAPPLPAFASSSTALSRAAARALSPSTSRERERAEEE